jgi:hypothetical protein
MSATIRVTSGTVKVRLDGVVDVVHAPFVFEGVEWDPAVPKDDPSFKDQVLRKMDQDLTCPAVGSASEPFNKVEGVFSIEAVDEPVFLVVYSDKTSPHPDETFGQPAPSKEIVLNPGEIFESAVIEDNAWTALFLTA